MFTRAEVRAKQKYVAPDTDQDKRLRAEKSRQGWYADVPAGRPHLCFPPKAFPQQVGSPEEGSHWSCETCGSVWLSEGIQLVNGYGDYPTGANRSQLALLGPSRWFLKLMGPRAKKSAALVDFEQGLYDFRPLGPYYVKMWRAQLEAMGVDWRAFSS